MHILLPPSETKRSGGGSILSPATLTHHAELGEARVAVRAALESLCADEEAAATALKLGVKSRGEIANNLALGDSGTMPAIERYTGVLYDALALSSASATARDWIGDHVSIQSALFGLIAADDRIPAYRLSAGSRLPTLAAPLKRVWKDAHEHIDWDSFGWILDLRSKDYAHLAPLPEGCGAALDIVQRGPDGQTRALNHFNKAAKGDLVRRLAVTAPGSGAARVTGTGPIDSVETFIAWGAAQGLELTRGAHPGRITLVTDLGAPVATDLIAPRERAATSMASSVPDANPTSTAIPAR